MMPPTFRCRGQQQAKELRYVRPITARSQSPLAAARAATVCGTSGKFCPAEWAIQLLEASIEPGDRVAIEGDN
jgi:hypothetical protein